MANVFPHSKSQSVKLNKGEMHRGFRLRSVTAVTVFLEDIIHRDLLLDLLCVGAETGDATLRGI